MTAHPVGDRQHQKRGDEHERGRHALHLAAGELDAARPDQGIETLFQLASVLLQRRQADRPGELDLLGG